MISNFFPSVFICIAPFCSNKISVASREYPLSATLLCVLKSKHAFLHVYFKFTGPFTSRGAFLYSSSAIDQEVFLFAVFTKIFYFDV